MKKFEEFIKEEYRAMGFKYSEPKEEYKVSFAIDGYKMLKMLILSRTPLKMY